MHRFVVIASDVTFEFLTVDLLALAFAFREQTTTVEVDRDVLMKNYSFRMTTMPVLHRLDGGLANW